jgi:hypothetical protein
MAFGSSFIDIIFAGSRDVATQAAVTFVCIVLPL